MPTCVFIIAGSPAWLQVMLSLSSDDDNYYVRRAFDNYKRRHGNATHFGEYAHTQAGSSSSSQIYETAWCWEIIVKMYWQTWLVTTLVLRRSAHLGKELVLTLNAYSSCSVEPTRNSNSPWKSDLETQTWVGRHFLGQKRRSNGYLLFEFRKWLISLFLSWSRAVLIIFMWSECVRRDALHDRPDVPATLHIVTWGRNIQAEKNSTTLAVQIRRILWRRLLSRWSCCWFSCYLFLHILHITVTGTFGPIYASSGAPGTLIIQFWPSKTFVSLRRLYMRATDSL